MRIIGGDFKRRILRFPKEKKTRPMMDRIKETVFNLLGDTVKDSRVLDLFAGSGSLGLEALSRGASFCTFVEWDETACDIIRKNLASLAINRSKWDVSSFPASQSIRRLAKKGRKYHLLFLDPPFDKGFLKKVLRQLEGFDIVEPFGKIVYQRSAREALPQAECLRKFKLFEERKIGQAYIGSFILIK